MHRDPPTKGAVSNQGNTCDRKRDPNRVDELDRHLGATAKHVHEGLEIQRQAELVRVDIEVVQVFESTELAARHFVRPSQHECLISPNDGIAHERPRKAHEEYWNYDPGREPL